MSSEQSIPILTESQRETLLQLWLMPGVGIKTIQALMPLIVMDWSLAHGVNPQKIALQPRQIAALTHVGNQEKARVQLDAVKIWAQQPNQTLIVLGDTIYPRLLAKIHSPPPVLMIQGQVSWLGWKALGMVGSRNASNEGLQNASAFAKFLVGHQYVIVSGGAGGIDRAAHEACMNAGGGTLAVLGHGLNRCYPAAHRRFYQSIAEQGALISEFPLDVSPRAEFFPRRNRIISGLSFGICVVEAGLPSGTLTTARWAQEQNREVFAIPGSINNPRTKGCHYLIQQGAKLVQSGEDILSELGHFESAADNVQSTSDIIGKPKPGSRTKIMIEADSSLELQIAVRLQESPGTVEELCLHFSELPLSTLLSALSILEIEGVVKRDSITGQFFYC